MQLPITCLLPLLFPPAAPQDPAPALQDPVPALQDPAPVPEPREPAAPVELHVRALANAGFLLSAGDSHVALDPFVAKPYGKYGALPPEVHAKLVAAEDPFDDLDLVLTSHIHPDHFQLASATAFLAGPSQAVFVSSREVCAAVEEAVPAGTKERLVAFLPEHGETEHIVHAGVEVRALRLSHGTGRFARIQNLGYVITIGGQKVLHLGDAQTLPANFTPYRTSALELDVALVPFWYFLSEAGREVLQRCIRARKLIAYHIPPVDLAKVRERLAETHPEVVVLAQPLDGVRVAPRASSTGDPGEEGRKN